MKKIPLTVLLSLFVLGAFAQTSPVQIIKKCAVQAGGLLCWSATEDSSEMVYLLQQFRWNKWVNWDTLFSEMRTDTASYSVSISKYIHSGENVFRVLPFADGKPQKSSEKIIYKADSFGELLEQVMYPSKTDYVIEFKRETQYELYNKFGEIVRQGYGKSFSRKGLDGDVYYLNYDNKTTEVMWSYKVE